MSDRLRILVFAPYYPPHVGGVEQYSSELHARLALRPEVEHIGVLTPRLPRDAPPREQPAVAIEVRRFPAFEPVPNYPVPLPGARTQRAEDRLAPNLLVSHTRFFVTSLMALAAARRTGTPWLHIEHGADVAQLGRGPTALAARAYDRTLGRLVLVSADAVAAVSEAAAGFVHTLSGRSASVLYRGTSGQEVAPIPADEGLRQRLSRDRIVTYLGRLIEGKGVPKLIEAFRRLDDPGAVLCLVGDGPARKRLERKAAGLAVAFLGELPFTRAIGVVKASDVVVNPSYTEGLPTAVIEAALCGRAVVATDVGGTREVISNGTSGLIVPPRDAPALERALRQLLEDGQLRQRLGERARTEVTHRFDWERSVDDFLALAASVRGA